MSVKVFLSLLAALLLSLCAALYAGSKALEYRRIAQDKETALRASQEELQAVRLQVAQVVFQVQQSRQEVKEAVDANPEWRDAAVPAAVADRLCKQLRCK